MMNCRIRSRIAFLLCLGAGLFFLGVASPAAANGFDFMCRVPAAGGGGGTGGGTTLADKGVQIFDGIDMSFTGSVPAGVPVTLPGATITTDPVTGRTLFTVKFNPRLGEFGLDFLGSQAGVDIGWRLQPRLLTNVGPLDVGLTSLFKDSFGLPYDFPGNNIGVAGLDASFFGSRALKDMSGGFKATLSVGINFRLSDNSRRSTRVSISLDSTTAGAEFPERDDMSLVFKKVEGTVPSGFVGLGQAVQMFDMASQPALNQPGLGVAVDVNTIDTSPSGGFVEAPLLHAAENWNHMPRTFAAGVRQLCAPWDPSFRSTGHVAWVHKGLPNPAAANLGLSFHYGIGAGIPIDLDGSAATVERADSVVVDGAISAVPSRLDAILHPDAMSITRSPDVAPNIALGNFQLAEDDPATAADMPTQVSGNITQLPRHVFANASFPAAGGIDRLDLSSWNLQCPGEPAPPGSAAPADVSRNDITDTLPIFPVGCTRFSLTPIPDAQVLLRNSLPQDLRAAAALSGLAAPPLSANQFAYYATRTTHPLGAVELFHYGAHVRGLRRVVYDATGAPLGGDRLRLFVDRGPDSGADDSLRAVVDADSRTNLSDEVASSRTRLHVEGTVPDLPDVLRADYSTDPTTLLHLTWRASSPMAVMDGSADIQLAGPTARRIAGAFETGPVGGGALPPAGDILLTRNTGPVADDVLTAVHYTTPGPPGDTFPTPTVPAFDPSIPARIHAGATLSNRDERLAGKQLRVHADLAVPQGVDVSWRQSGDSLAEVTGSLCVSGTPACAATRLDATATYGPDLGPVSLLTRPVLPAVQSEVAAAVQPFAEWRPGSGVRALLLADDKWAADAVVDGVSSFHYVPGPPQDVAVQLGHTSPQPFDVELLDATGSHADATSTQRPQILFVDAHLSDLPAQMRVRAQEAGPAGGAEPWIWVNTEDVNISNFADVDLTPDPPGTRPVLTGVARIGDRDYLSGQIPVSARTTAARTVNGADAWAHLTPTDGRLAVDVVAQLEVPRHVAIWEPATQTCAPGVDGIDPSACQARRLYEMDRTDKVDLELKTTATTFGDLRALAHVITPQIDYVIKAGIEHIPGNLDGGVTLRRNLRLPWTGIDVDLHANAPLGNVTAEVFDQTSPTAYRLGADTTQPTSNYGVDLADVPADLAIHANIYGVEERLTNGRGDPGGLTTETGGLGYLHASIDLGGAATVVNVNALQSGSGNTTAVLDADAPISGFVNGRMDHVRICPPAAVACNQNQDPTVFMDALPYLLGLASAAGVLAGVPYLGPALIALAVGAVILAILYDGTVTFEPDVDFDLPVYAEFHDVTAMRLGVRGNTVSLDEQHGPGGGDPLTFGFRQRSLPNETALEVDGAWYYHREIEYSYDSTIEDFDIEEHGSDFFGVVGLYSWDLCDGEDDEDDCNVPPQSRDNIASLTDFSTTRRPGWDSADILFDPLFSPSSREELEDEDAGLVEPSVKLYGGMAENSPPLEESDFRMPSLTDSTVRAQTDTTDITLEHLDISTFSAFFADCPAPRPYDDDAARGNDGTTYRLVPLCTPVKLVPSTTDAPDELVLGTALEATHNPDDTGAEDEVGRWLVELADPVGYGGNGDNQCEDDVGTSIEVVCTVSSTIEPQTDGSVQVTTTTTRDGDELGTVQTWVDASGHPAFHRENAAEVNGFTTDTSFTMGSGGTTTLDPCSMSYGTVFGVPLGCGPLPDVSIIGIHFSVRAVWVFGDGTVSEQLAVLGPVTHTYPAAAGPDRYFAELLLVAVPDGAEKGELISKKYASVSD